MTPLALLLFAACASGPRLRPFTTDGCSMVPNGPAEHKELWLDCCREHDHRYWMGGTELERLSADQTLRECVAGVGRPNTAGLMLTGVRVGGTPYLPTGFRWGYGWRYPRGYAPLTDDERRLVEEAEPR